MESIFILYKGGRLPNWHKLSTKEQDSYQQKHVNLMLSIAKKYRLQRLEGFRLMAPQDTWERFWIIEFPSLVGAEAWIKAEMAPPYGSYGYYEYNLGRTWIPEFYPNWESTDSPSVPVDSLDPKRIPVLKVNKATVVVILFERDKKNGGVRKQCIEENYLRSMYPVSQVKELIRLECFNLIAPQATWSRVWLAEFRTIARAEKWIDAQAVSHQSYSSDRIFQLTRRWAPTYFTSWVQK